MAPWQALEGYKVVQVCLEMEMAQCSTRQLCFLHIVSHRYYVFQQCNPGSVSWLNDSFLYINGWYQPHRLGLCSRWVLMLHLTQHSSSPTENIHKYINVHCCVLLGCWGECLGNDNTDPSRSSRFPNPSYHLLSLLKQYMFIYPSICLRGL